jgi:allantoin racemase
MRIAVINPNTSTSMTGVIEAAARAATSAGVEIVALQPTYGPRAIDSAAESYLAAAAVMELAPALRDSVDAVVLAGFGEHGRDGLAELIDAPVFDIAEAAAHVAMMLGRSYSVVTTLTRSIAAIEDRLRLAGLFDRCASVRACGLSTAEVDANPAGAVSAILAQARRAVHDDRAEVICLGCGGLAELDATVAAALGVPVVDGVAAAVRLAQAVVGLGLRTSKVCTFARPEPNEVLPRDTT